MTKPLSPTMKGVLAIVLEHGGILERRPGGFWTYLGCPWDGSAPQWYTGTSTVEALVARDKMAYTRWQQRSRKKGGGDFPIEAKLI